jgi:hypothetical protein
MLLIGFTEIMKVLIKCCILTPKEQKVDIIRKVDKWAGGVRVV